MARTIENVGIIVLGIGACLVLRQLIRLALWRLRERKPAAERTVTVEESQGAPDGPSAAAAFEIQPWQREFLDCHPTAD